MRYLTVLLAGLLDKAVYLFFSFWTGAFYTNGVSVACGLFYQFSIPLQENELYMSVISMPDIYKTGLILRESAHYAVQSLDILFAFCSILIILFHIVKIFESSSLKTA